ncbi:MAG: biotin transporter BioY [Deltaproteobacteria bacterium]|nr:biotin transporter BioY [Deltaproteobacteria bacterium]
MIHASMFGAATAAGAYMVIPLPPVPITLQTLLTGLSGALLGGRLGALSQVVYVLLGIIGLPVFAGGKAGLGVLFGPTGGYLLGFIAAGYLTGRLVESREKPGFLWVALSILAGFGLIYLLGIAQLSLVAGLSLTKALSLGMIPFLVGDLLKVIAAALITLWIRDRIKT